jgi:hypothetical protein
MVIADAIVVEVLGTVTSADANGIGLVAVAITIAFGNVGAPALINQTRPVANATSIQGAYTCVNVIAYAITVGIFGASSSALANHVCYVAFAVAVACGDIRTTAVINGPWSIANSTFIITANAGVHIITHPIFIAVGCAGSSAVSNGI